MVVAARPDAVVAGRLPSLTGMRFVAALLVFVSHLVDVEALPRDHAVTAALDPPAVAAGALGVDFFFVLSGFVLTFSARTGDTAGRFLRRRAAKILPGHVVVWAGALVVGLLAAEPPGVVDAVSNLLLVHAWTPGTTAAAVDVPTWSLSVEVVFYLLFPLVLRWVRGLPVAALWWVGGVLVAAVVLLAALVTVLGGMAGGTGPSFEQVWLAHAFPPVRLPEFALGVVAARLLETGRWPRVPLLPACGVLVVAFAVQSLVARTAFGVAAVVVVPVTLVIGAAAAADVRGARSVLRARLPVWLGEISYAFFLTHYLVLHYGHRWLFGTGQVSLPAAAGIAAVLLLATVLVSAALYRGVERPLARRWR